MKFQVPKGTRDFLASDMLKRQKVMDIIRKTFECYGFEPIDTPAFETFDLLSAKGGGGEEIKKEVYYFKDKAGRELGLRFDFTVPLARIVASNPSITRPFKVYRIDKVWRYDQPQAGRYREFVQCDVDIAGLANVNADAECLAVVVSCLEKLGIKNFYVKINNRKLLESFVLGFGVKKENMANVFRIIDKLSKIGKEEVKKELGAINVNPGIIEELKYNEKIKSKLDKEGFEGLKELEDLVKISKPYGMDKKLKIDLSLVRGLEYYTGNVFEIISKEGEKLGVQVGSIGGGGRYDNLIQLYGGPKTPAVGISLGLDRIVEILEIKKSLKWEPTKTKVFVANIGNTKEKVIEIARKIRNVGIPAQTNLTGKSIGGQLEFCNSKKIPYVIIVGEKELKENKIKIKDMKKKTETEIKISEIENLKNMLK